MQGETIFCDFFRLTVLVGLLFRLKKLWVLKSFGKLKGRGITRLVGKFSLSAEKLGWGTLQCFANFFPPPAKYFVKRGVGHFEARKASNEKVRISRALNILNSAK